MNNDSINQETAYAIIARCLQLTHTHDNFYKDTQGNSFMLTKYGFEPVSKENTALLIKQMMLYNENLSKEIADLKLVITNLQKHANEYKNKMEEFENIIRTMKKDNTQIDIEKRKKILAELLTEKEEDVKKLFEKNLLIEKLTKQLNTITENLRLSQKKCKQLAEDKEEIRLKYEQLREFKIGKKTS